MINWSFDPMVVLGIIAAWALGWATSSGLVFFVVLFVWMVVSVIAARRAQ